MATIQNLESEVILKCENRTQDGARADVWIRDALIEISGNPAYRESFTELEVTGPLFNLTGGPLGVAVEEYDESNFITTPDFNLRSLQIFLWIDYPTNQIRKMLEPTSYQDANKFQSFPSLPSEWYRYGNLIGIHPAPLQNYQVQARYMREHPITDYYNTQGMLNQTVILFPNEWLEVLEWAAAMRGFMELLEFEKAAQVRTLLYGDPKAPNDNPGLIKSVISKRKAEAWMQQQPLRPLIKSSCWGR